MKTQKRKIKPVDEWGDEGNWVTIVDFTKIKKGGVPAEEVMRALKANRNNKKWNWPQQVRPVEVGSLGRSHCRRFVDASFFGIIPTPKPEIWFYSGIK